MKYVILLVLILYSCRRAKNDNVTDSLNDTELYKNLIDLETENTTLYPRVASFIIPPWIEYPLTSNDTQNDRKTVLVKRLCGYPMNYDGGKCLQLNATYQTLSNCEYNGGSAIFGIVVCLLSLMILLANSLVIFVIFKINVMRTKYNFIKASLAVADSLCGFVLLASILPNIIYVRNSTENELVGDTFDSISASNIFFGAILTMSFQSSLLHLMFLSIYRFMAMKWPLEHRQQKLSTLLIILGSLWVTSMVCSFVPAAFEDIFGFTFQPVLYFPMLTMKLAVGNETRYQGPLYLAIIYGLPYIIMVVVSIYTGITLRQKLRERASKFGGKNCTTDTYQQTSTSHSQAPENPKSNLKEKTKQNTPLKPEISIFLTLLAMIGAFTITLVPGLVVQLLFFSKTLDCSNYSIPYTISFYIAMANGFANVLIYSFRDVRFRKAVGEVFKCKQSKQRHSSEFSTKNTKL